MAQPPSEHFRIDTPDVDSSIVKNGSRNVEHTRQPERLVRTLKMPLLRKDVDQCDTVSAKVSQKNVEQQAKVASSKKHATVQHSGKRQARPATVVEQLKHCLAQYELLQKQLLCAELTGTSVTDQQKFEQTAVKLIHRITRLRKQLSAKAESANRTMSQTPVMPNRSVAVKASKTKSDPVSQRVQPKRTVKLSVSHPTAAVLKAFADAGKRPSALVERALWADRDVQDAALLLKLKSPIK